MSDRDPLLAILRGLHDALAQLADTTHWAAERARESLSEVDRLLREQEQADRMLRMPHAALCDVCEQRPGDRRVLAAGGIETWVCGPCVGDDEPVEDA